LREKPNYGKIKDKRTYRLVLTGRRWAISCTCEVGTDSL